MSNYFIQDFSDFKFENMFQNIVSCRDRVILELIDGICAFLDDVSDELLGD